MDKKPDLILPFDVWQTVLNYLATKPYREVIQYIAVLERLQPVPEAAAESKERDD